MANRHIVFICTGNICRSPMAEYLFRSQAGPECGWEASSAGIMALDGAPASTLAVEVMREKGLDLRPHRSRGMTQELASQADVIVTMTLSHRAQLWALYRQLVEQKMFVLNDFDPAAAERDIADPIGSSIAVYRSSRNQIDAAMPGLIAFLSDLHFEGGKPSTSGNGR